MLKNKGGKSLVEFLPSRSFPLFQQCFLPTNISYISLPFLHL